MEIQTFVENINHGEYTIDCVLPNGNEATVYLNININLRGGYDIKIYDLKEGEYLNEIKTDFLCIDISDWLLEAWDEAA